MEIGQPHNVCHVAHVTFDRFNGFLGLPIEFEPKIPRRTPSARHSFLVSACIFFDKGLVELSFSLSFEILNINLYLESVSPCCCFLFKESMSP